MRPQMSERPVSMPPALGQSGNVAKTLPIWLGSAISATFIVRLIRAAVAMTRADRVQRDAKSSTFNALTSISAGQPPSRARFVRRE